MPKTKKTKTPVEYEQQIGELTATLQRVQADFENYKKRVAAEQANMLDTAKLAILSQLLPALDNFDRAAAHLPKELVSNNWAQGMSYVGTQLEQILDELGVKKFDITGKHFDPSRAEAVEHVENKQPEGTVLEQITPGYEIGGTVVRPATVKVAKNSNHSKVKEGDL